MRVCSVPASWSIAILLCACTGAKPEPPIAEPAPDPTDEVRPSIARRDAAASSSPGSPDVAPPDAGPGDASVESADAGGSSARADGSLPRVSMRPRVFVTTDIGGDDPDDFQSMVHFLVYADRFDVEGIVAGWPRGRQSAALEVIEAYERDHAKLAPHGPYPTAAQLRQLTKQGSRSGGPESPPTDGARLLIQRAKSTDPRPLWVLAWGSLTDVAVALSLDASIKPKLRVYSIGSWNTEQDRSSRDRVASHKDLWWIENDTTFRGMYMGGSQSGDLGNTGFPRAHVAGHGALGDLFMRKKSDIKMGDTPSVLYLLWGSADDPTSEHWGGQFSARADRPQGWTDRNSGARESVSRWRESYLRDWQKRMERLK